MAICTPIPQERIRAELWFGNTRIAKTPYILSFNVTKARSQISDTFSMQLEVLAVTSFPLGQNLQIRAGIRGNLKTIFTGVIKQTRIDPAFGKPSYFKMSISGSGVLSQLEGKKFSRRLRSAGQGMYCMITSGGDRVDAYYSLDGSKLGSGNKEFIGPSLSPSKSTGGENTPVILYNAHAPGGGTQSRLGSLVSDSSGTTSTQATDGLTIHTHESIEEGGPAFGVYSSE
jgi:hypothetical protein